MAKPKSKIEVKLEEKRGKGPKTVKEKRLETKRGVKKGDD